MRARIISMVVLAASLLAVSPVWAQSDGSFTVGGGFWSQTNPEAKYREYRDLPRGGFLSDYVLREFSGPWAGAVWGSGPTRNDQSHEAYLAKGIRWRMDAEFSATPHLFSQVARSPYTQVAPGIFVLSDSMQRVIQNAVTGTNATVQNQDLRELLRTSPNVALGVQTDVTSVRLRGRPMKDWQFEVKGTDRERSGSQALGATMGGPGGPMVELPAPINQHTVDVDATGSYVHGPARLMLNVGMSEFRNRITQVRFDNFKVFNTAYAGTASAARSALNAMSVMPDNDEVRARLTGSWKLPRAWTATAMFGVSQSTQKADFLPMTVNDTILVRSRVGTDSLALARPNLDGKVTNLVADARVTGRPMPKLYVTGRLHWDKLDDKTEPLGFKYGFVNYDQTLTRNAVESEPEGNSHGVGGLDVEYSVNNQVDVSLMLEHRWRELPEEREVTADAENIFGARVHVRPITGTDVAVGAQMGQRRMDAFDEDVFRNAAAPVNFSEWPDLRRYDIADRDKTKFDGTVSWFANPKLDLSVSGWYAKDDYPNSVLGLQSSTTTQMLVEGSLHPTKTVDFSGGFGYGLQKSEQKSIEDGTSLVSTKVARAPWTANFDDKNAYAFAKMDWWARPKTLQMTLDYTFIRDLQTYDFSMTYLPDSVGALPNTNTVTAQDYPAGLFRTNDVALTATWHRSAQLELACTYGYTQYDVADLLGQRIPYVNINTSAGNLNTAATGIFLGTTRSSYTAHRFQIAATRRF